MAGVGDALQDSINRKYHHAMVFYLQSTGRTNTNFYLLIGTRKQNACITLRIKKIASMDTITSSPWFIPMCDPIPDLSLVLFHKVSRTRFRNGYKTQVQEVYHVPSLRSSLRSSVARPSSIVHRPSSINHRPLDVSSVARCRCQLVVFALPPNRCHSSSTAGSRLQRASSC